LLRIERSVVELARSVAFYEGALGFSAATAAGQGLAVLRRDSATLVLREGGTGENVSACCQAFQHIALPVSDMAVAMARLAAFAPPMISVGGPQLLPASSGGVTAIKFRDPDGLPVEFLQFPDGRAGGIDHSAIVVADVARSIDFYRDRLGLRVVARQVNAGVEQDRLDGLDRVEVEVVALSAEVATPHIELLGYRRPSVVPRAPGDISATRLVFEADGEAIFDDPDGHKISKAQ
jgi:catechol 2,3-dioxygenase-like lactoylglutathione lyase family enzyme